MIRDPGDGGLLASRVCARTGATYRQLDLWTRSGYVASSQPPTPRSGKTEGSGVPRTWSQGEVDVIAAMVPLVAAGVLPEAAARAARAGGWLGPGVRVLVGEAAHAPEAMTSVLEGQEDDG